MKWLVGLLGCLVMTAAAEAQTGVYRVIGVDSTDVLNIRAEADPRSAILATLAFDAALVEVLEEEGGWGRVLLEEGSGWVSMRHLEPMDRPRAGAFDAPGNFQCMGTEPFWGAEIGVDGSVSYYDALTMGEQQQADLTLAETASARFTPYHYVFEGAVTGHLIIDAQACSDGMSDRDFGWRAYLFADDREGGRRFVEGCCMTPLPN